MAVIFLSKLLLVCYEIQSALSPHPRPEFSTCDVGGQTGATLEYADELKWLFEIKFVNVCSLPFLCVQSSSILASTGNFVHSQLQSCFAV